MRYLDGKKTHAELLKQLWGVDIDKFPAHLATINLAIRNLAEEENYPNVVYSDFFDIPGPKTRITIGVRPNLAAWLDPGEDAGGKPTVGVTGLDAKTLERDVPLMDCVVGNPPYTRQEELEDEVFGERYKERIMHALKADFPDLELAKRSGIYAYFFPHGAKFLRVGGRLGFVCLRSWLDTSYGRTLGSFFLDHFKIVAVIESSAEKWFEDAQMLPVVVILEACKSKSARSEHEVKFVQLKVPLAEIIPPIPDDRDLIQEIHRWKETDRFVRSIEEPEVALKPERIPFLGGEIKLHEDDKLRVVIVSQEQLKKDSKWGKFLGAPSAFYRVLGAGRGRMCKLGAAARLSLGTKTGANEFFVIPNRLFSVRVEGSYCVLIDRGTEKEVFRIEKEFLKPVVVKIKTHREISLTKTDGYLLNVTSKKADLQKARKRVLQYIEYGEDHPILLKRGKAKGTTIRGYQNIRSVQGRTLSVRPRFGDSPFHRVSKHLLGKVSGVLERGEGVPYKRVLRDSTDREGRFKGYLRAAEFNALGVSYRIQWSVHREPRQDNLESDYGIRSRRTPNPRPG